MSTNAIKSFRIASKAYSTSTKEDRLAHDASRAAEDAIKCAAAARAASVRAGSARGENGAAALAKCVKGARAAAERAQVHAREAIRLGDERDVAGAAFAARDAVRAAEDAGVYAASAAVLIGAKKELASDKETELPAGLAAKKSKAQERAERERNLTAAIERSMRYLVTYGGEIISGFANEEDAFLFEGELADLDVAHGTECAKCEVIERATGERLGGYLLAGGALVVLLKDDEYERRFRVGRH